MKLTGFGGATIWNGPARSRSSALRFSFTLEQRADGAYPARRMSRYQKKSGSKSVRKPIQPRRSPRMVETDVHLMWRQREDGRYECAFVMKDEMTLLPGTFESEADAKMAIEVFVQGIGAEVVRCQAPVLVDVDVEPPVNG